jgi:hypothetical protein
VVSHVISVYFVNQFIVCEVCETQETTWSCLPFPYCEHAYYHSGNICLLKNENELCCGSAKLVNIKNLLSQFCFLFKVCFIY